MNIQDQIAKIIKDEIEELSIEDINSILEVPPNKDMGDYAFPCFRLAKIYHKAPNIIAKDVAEQLEKHNLFEEVKVVGAYVNIYISKQAVVETVYKQFEEKGDKFGTLDIGEGKTIVLDYSSPNIAKPFHIGHLRTTVIGNSIYKIYKALGYDCVRVNHLGDWGTQFGKMIVAYKNWGNKDDIEQKGISELMRLYVKFHEEAEKQPELDDEARAWFAKMEKGNEEALNLWNWFKTISMKEFERVYDLLGVSFDSYAGESFYNDKMAPVVKELDDKGLLKDSEGAKIVDLEEDNMPPCLIMKKDGSTLYATRDITASIYRKNTYNFDKCIYVTALDQKLHFAQWFKVIEKMGYDWFKNLIHVPYGLVSLESGKLSTRKGKFVYLEDLLKESIDKTKEIINQKNPNLENSEKVAHDVGIGAIIFNDLFNNRIKDVMFSWDKVLNFDGETGPYVQYTHARTCSVLNKGNVTELDQDIDYTILTDQYSVDLLKQIEKFPNKIIDASEKLEPYIITRYLVDVAKAFNKFYHENSILVDEDNVKKARLSLVYMVKTVLCKGLSLLGINAPEKM